MKANSKFTALILGAVLLASCDSVDYPDRFVQTSGVPTVDFIRYADKDVVITQASMEELVCIVGDNLTSVHELYFNDQAAVLNTSYMTDKTLLVSVPRTMPSVQTNKIYMITKDGQEVTYDFTVLPPVPKVSGMSLEWAQPGESVSIYGSYLFDPVEVEFPGADPVKAVAGDGSAVTVVIPEGAQPGKVKVTTASGTAQSVFQYKDTRGMLFDFDGLTGLDNHGWNGHNSQDDDGTGISGRFFQFGDGETALDGSWEESHFSFVYWPGSWNTPENYQDGAMGTRLLDLADFSDWQNMALKFEIFVPSSNPWSNTPMQICMAGVDVVSFGGEGTDIYGHAVAGANNIYMSGDGVPSAPRAFYKPWEATGSFDTGDKWVTVTIPFTEFNLGWDGKVASYQLTAESFASIWIFICNGGVESDDASCVPIIKIDNISAVPYK